MRLERATNRCPRQPRPRPPRCNQLARPAPLGASSRTIPSGEGTHEHLVEAQASGAVWSRRVAAVRLDARCRCTRMVSVFAVCTRLDRMELEGGGSGARSASRQMRWRGILIPGRSRVRSRGSGVVRGPREPERGAARCGVCRACGSWAWWLVRRGRVVSLSRCRRPDHRTTAHRFDLFIQ